MTLNQSISEYGDILVVDDEASVVEVVALYLKREGFTVRVARDGRSALDAMREQLPALVVLDLMLPEVDGLEIMRRLRNDETSDVPVIMLTARRQETDRIYGLELGADDYVTKPFSPAELVSRVKAVLRRARSGSGGESGERPLKFNDLSIDPKTRIVTVRGQTIDLTATEFNLLWFMLSHPRQVFKRDQLLENVWGFSEYVDPSTVTVHIRRLREKIEIDPSDPVHLLTVWGVGYKFDPG
ncbi:Phosphate regulon transcriptional regulatory protein PhoB (SphR) [hydrothermal vent metagenome]|uniref:Phosphate regulon transcriptional regulatory protein PhoB (SphR) n=1 Tax=hydrothermal vent metagenome TaxID=652676 RepID=A0A3B0UUL8_9ZZZZ